MFYLRVAGRVGQRAGVHPGQLPDVAVEVFKTMGVHEPVVLRRARGGASCGRLQEQRHRLVRSYGKRQRPCGIRYAGRLLDGRRTLADVVAAVAADFGVELTAVADDVAATIAEFVSLGLLATASP